MDPTKDPRKGMKAFLQSLDRESYSIAFTEIHDILSKCKERDDDYLRRYVCHSLFWFGGIGLYYILKTGICLLGQYLVLTEVFRQENKVRTFMADQRLMYESAALEWSQALMVGVKARLALLERCYLLRL